ncbi:MAG TPA: hypothetical protein VH684_07110 [Xanthobacteraceae bacterium]
MTSRTSMIGVAVAASLSLWAATAQAFDDAKYPDLSGQWVAVRFRVGGQPAFDPTKPWGRGQQAPLTSEYQKVLEASLAEQAKGNQGNWLSGVSCLPTGMPAMMTLYRPMEIIVLPDTTYVRIDHTHQSHRRIFTDGRDWPNETMPSFRGYSIGKWVDTDGDGKYDVLEVETRFLQGPRALDPAGMPTHADNMSIVKERIYFDISEPTLLHDEITLLDHAFTRPWTVLKTYRRVAEKHPEWAEDSCDNEGMVKIGNETYYRSADGTIMPTDKDQPPPDLRYFEQR